MEIAAIGAMARNRVIGDSRAERGIPWDCPEDMKRFRALTKGHIVAMGRTTFHLCGALPGRLNWVLSRSPHDIASTDKLQGLASLPEMLSVYRALVEAGDERILWIIGGAGIWQQAFPLCNRLEMTVIPEDVQGDTLMPLFEDLGWSSVMPVQGETCTFITYRR